LKQPKSDKSDSADGSTLWPPPVFRPSLRARSVDVVRTASVSVAAAAPGALAPRVHRQRFDCSIVRTARTSATAFPPPLRRRHREGWPSADISTL